MLTPNLFVVGAPKCGTSSLFDGLTRHPDVVGTRPKEPFVLMDRDHPLARRPNVHDAGLAVYVNLFPDEATAAPVRLEATTHYLYQETARACIAGLGDARAVAVLREPAARVFSSFRYTANNRARLARDLTFARYLELVERGEPLYPRWCRDHRSAYVLEREVDRSRYLAHLRPWLEGLGADRMRVVLFEDLRARPRAVVADLLAWLGLDPGGLGEIDAAGRNRTVEVRHRALHRAAVWMNGSLRPPAPVRSLMKRGYAALQYAPPAAPSPADAAALARLRHRFADDNAALAAAPGIDLSAWAREAAATEPEKAD